MLRQRKVASEINGQSQPCLVEKCLAQGHGKGRCSTGILTHFVSRAESFRDLFASIIRPIADNARSKRTAAEAERIWLQKRNKELEGYCTKIERRNDDLIIEVLRNRLYTSII